MKAPKELIKYRIEKAWNTLEDAELLVSEDRGRSALNRMYYASFYAALALLLSIGETPKTHKGTKNQFYEFFIKTEILPKEIGKFYQNLFKNRMEQDYDDYADIENIDIQSYLEQTRKFIQAIESLLIK
jgi:uncharacterized protein (UPF0332 family)